MGIPNMLGGLFALKRLIVEVRGVRKSLERIATVQEELLLLKARGSRGFATFVPEPDPHAEGGEILNQSDEEFARFEGLEHQRGGPDSTLLDEDLDELEGAEWLTHE